MPPPDATAMEFVRDALSALRTDVRDLRVSVERSISDADSRFSALESCPCPRQAVASPAPAPAPATGIRGLLETYSWVPTAAKLAYPALLVFGILWSQATPATRSQVKDVAATAAGLRLDSARTDALTAASAAANAEWWSQRVKAAGGPH